jgi:hypothetical protein
MEHRIFAEPRLITIPISHLNPIAHGVRKTNGISIDALAASIAAEGLLQNLTVVADPEAPLAGAEEFQSYQVIAGSRRLRALRKLVADEGSAGRLRSAVPGDRGNSRRYRPAWPRTPSASPCTRPTSSPPSAT